MARHFEEELKQLKEKLLKMSSLVEGAFSTSIKALLTRDEGLARKVIDEDAKVNTLEIEIDDLCLRFLALHQPQASDLRFIAATMKINNDLERMGDLAVNIGQRAIDVMNIAPLKPNENISKIAEAVQKMLRDSIDAFVNNDPKMAQCVCERDDEVDKLNRKIFREMVEASLPDKKAVEQSVDIILVANNLERIADLATNICEDVIYMVDGRVIKHHAED